MRTESDEDEQVLGAMVREQVCANALQTLKGQHIASPSHPKLEEAVRIIQEDLEGEKILVYSRFIQTLDIFEKLLKTVKVPVYRITGAENQIQRDKNRSSWIKTKGTSILLITSAGGAGLNLQAASTLILIDRPWSGGELDQIRGRIHRIGTKHANLLEINLVAEDTIDEYVLSTLKIKGKDVNKVFGETDKPISLDDIKNKRWELLKKLRIE